MKIETEYEHGRLTLRKTVTYDEDDQAIEEKWGGYEDPFDAWPCWTGNSKEEVITNAIANLTECKDSLTKELADLSARLDSLIEMRDGKHRCVYCGIRSHEPLNHEMCVDCWVAVYAENRVPKRIYD
jgi:hypothetical protein